MDVLPAAVDTTASEESPTTPGDGRAASGGRAASAGRERRRRHRADLAVVAFAAAWCAANVGRIADPLGLNHDGQNAGVFGSGARALLADPFGSHLGSHLADGHGVYANHPPLLTWLIGVSELIIGESTVGLRLPTVVATLLLIAATYRLLCALDLSPWSAAAGTIVGLGAPMCFVYGTMPDTPMLGLPVTTWLLVDIIRTERGAPRPTRRLVAVAAVAALCGWEAVAITGLIVVTGMFRIAPATATQDSPYPNLSPVERLRIARRVGDPVAAGLAVGLTIAVAWIAWAYDGFDTIASQFLTRTGGSRAAFGVADAITTQVRYLADVYGPVLVAGLVAAPAALRVQAIRRYLPTIAVGCLIYQVAFWQAATVHDYWSYWWQLPIALSVAGAVEARRRSSLVPSRVTAVSVAFAIAVGPALTLVGGSDAERSYEAGLDVIRLLERTPLADDQESIPIMGFGEPTSWISWEMHRPVIRLDLASLQDFAAEHPRWKVGVNCVAPRTKPGPPVCTLLDGSARRGGVAAVVDAGELAAATR